MDWTDGVDIKASVQRLRKRPGLESPKRVADGRVRSKQAITKYHMCLSRKRQCHRRARCRSDASTIRDRGGRAVGLLASANATTE